MKACDFLIVGGGAAGLSAAAELCEAGARVLVLEARRRIGAGSGRADRVDGRCRSSSAPNSSTAAARSSSRSSARPALVAVRLPCGASGVAARVFPRHGRRLAAFRGVDEEDAVDGWSRSFGRRVPRLAPKARGFRPPPPLVDGPGLRRRSARARQRAALSTAGEEPSDPDERAQFRILSGYASVVRWLEGRVERAGGKIRRAAVVREIRWRPKRVDVLTASGEAFRARAAVITLPVGVLKAAPGSRGAVVFDPEPAAIRRALAGVEMGDVVRLVLRFRESFWRDALGEAAFVHAAGAFQTLWTAAPVDLPMLTLWAGGPPATRLRERGRPAILDAAPAPAREPVRNLRGARAASSRRGRQPRLDRRSLLARRLQLSGRRRRRRARPPRPADPRHALLRGRSHVRGRERHGPRSDRERPPRRAAGAAPELSQLDGSSRDRAADGEKRTTRTRIDTATRTTARIEVRSTRCDARAARVARSASSARSCP